MGLLALCGTMLWVLRDLSPNSAIANEKAILLEAADGKSLGHVGPLKTSNATRAEFPAHLVGAVLSIEDRRFYNHWGVDLIGIARATARNYATGKILEGGSTITQQLAKLRLVGNERTFARKLREAFAAVWLETRFDKDAILTSYLNSVYMGAGAQGMPAAAELYFNKRPSQLTLSEAALLAGMVKAPSRFNPLRNLGEARARAAYVLRAMVENKQIDKTAAEAALARPAVLHPPAIAAQTASWFSDWVAQEARDVTGNFAGRLRVRTTLHPQMQDIAEQVVNGALDENARFKVSQAALVAMRPDGAVLAMVGGRNYKQSQFNRAVQAQRQPGSAFKTFVYLAALRKGWTASDEVDASPIEINDWQPKNFDDREFGSVTFGEAFARSINTAAVRLAVDVGLDQVIDAARDLGIDAPLPKVPSLALGSADVTLLNLTAAYAGILAGRVPIHPWGVASFASEDSPRLVSIGAPNGRQKPLGAVRDPLIQLLRRPVEEGTARAAARDGLAAGKTGTTQDHRDAWFIGFTENLVVGVWVGNDDRSPMDGITGGSIPATIWKSFITWAAPYAFAPQTANASEGIGASSDPANAVVPNDTARCDYRACSAKYQSFTAADCSYQPYGGGARQRCVNDEHVAAAIEAPTSRPTTMKNRSADCDVSACSATFASFRASDCSYQPHDGGPRKNCEKSDDSDARDNRDKPHSEVGLADGRSDVRQGNVGKQDGGATSGYRSLRQRLLEF